MSWGHWRLGPHASRCCRPPLHTSMTLIIHVTWQMRKLGSDKSRTSSRATARGRAGTHPARAPPSPVEVEREAPQLPFQSHFHPLLSSAPLLPTMARVVLPGGQGGSSPSRIQTDGLHDPRVVGSESQA